jgi:membrane-bound serine protease (ClpP class)
MPSTVIAIIAILATLIGLLVTALSRHKKASAGDIKLVGEIAFVEIGLAPEGSIIVRGELWRARSNDGSVISPDARVRVVGFEDYLALVEICD